jgi:hypothetical protein
MRGAGRCCGASAAREASVRVWLCFGSPFSILKGPCCTHVCAALPTPAQRRALAANERDRLPTYRSRRLPWGCTRACCSPACGRAPVMVLRIASDVGANDGKASARRCTPLLLRSLRDLPLLSRRQSLRTRSAPARWSIDSSSGSSRQRVSAVDMQAHLRSGSLLQARRAAGRRSDPCRAARGGSLAEPGAATAAPSGRALMEPAESSLAASARAGDASPSGFGRLPSGLVDHRLVASLGGPHGGVLTSSLIAKASSKTLEEVRTRPRIVILRGSEAFHRRELRPDHRRGGAKAAAGSKGLVPGPCA